jgi:hypothetical protein
MRRVFEATASDGTVFKRTTDRNRTYTHCVIVWCAATPEIVGKFHTWPAKPAGWARSGEWASRLDLAEKNARSWNARADSHGQPYRATILEAHEIISPARAHPDFQEGWEKEAAKGDGVHLESTGPNRFRLHLKN